MSTSQLGRKLVDHDGINNPEGRKQRRQQMEAILDGERATVRRLQRIAVASWAATLLIPIAGVLFALAPLDGGSPFILAVMLIGLLGGPALALAVITTIVWAFRSRTSTMKAIEMRLADIEDLIEGGRGSDGKR